MQFFSSSIFFLRFTFTLAYYSMVLLPNFFRACGAPSTLRCSIDLFYQLFLKELYSRGEQNNWVSYCGKKLMLAFVSIAQHPPPSSAKVSIGSDPSPPRQMLTSFMTAPLTIGCMCFFLKIVFYQFYFADLKYMFSLKKITLWNSGFDRNFSRHVLISKK